MVTRKQIFVETGSVGLPSKHVKYNIFVTFLLFCPLVVSILHKGRTVGPIFMLYGWNDVFPTKEVRFRGWNDRYVIWRKHAPKPPKVGVNIKFQAKMPKYKNDYLETINPIKPKFEDKGSTSNYTSGWSTITPKQVQHGWRPPSWKLLWRHNSGLIRINLVDWRRITCRWRGKSQNETPK